MNDTHRLEISDGMWRRGLGEGKIRSIASLERLMLFGFWLVNASKVFVKF